MTHSQNLEDADQRRGYRWFIPITTRWMDNDTYGHVNNVIYYSYFDTVANSFLIRRCGLDIHESGTIGYVVQSQCHYKKSIAFPDEIEGGLRINRVGNSSVEYGIAIFRAGEEQASAFGTLTHVFVDRKSEVPTPITAEMRAEFASIIWQPSEAE